MSLPPPTLVAVVLVPGFPVYVFTLVIEALRLSNKVLGRPAYDWRILSFDDAPAAASNGMVIAPDTRLAEDHRYQTVCLLAGYDHGQSDTVAFHGWLRAQARRGVRIGGIETGPFTLARAGLLGGVPVSVHFESAAAFAEEFPATDLQDGLFTISGNRFTGAGGAAALDLMLGLIAVEQGAVNAQKVAQAFVHDHIRGPGDGQRIARDAAGQPFTPALRRVLALMEETLEEPLPHARLVAASGLSARSLDRLFRSRLGTSPMRHYRELRLVRARHLVLNSDLAIREIALLTGFTAPSVFARAYAARFGRSARDDRAGFTARAFVPGARPPIRLASPRLTS